jgi:hypothetical protein
VPRLKHPRARRPSPTSELRHGRCRRSELRTPPAEPPLAASGVRGGRGLPHDAEAGRRSARSTSGHAMETSKPGVVAGGGAPTRVASFGAAATRAWFSRQSLAVQELRRRADGPSATIGSVGRVDRRRRAPPEQLRGPLPAAPPGGAPVDRTAMRAVAMTGSHTRAHRLRVLKTVTYGSVAAVRRFAARASAQFRRDGYRDRENGYRPRSAHERRAVAPLAWCRAIDEVPWTTRACTRRGGGLTVGAGHRCRRTEPRARSTAAELGAGQWHTESRGRAAGSNVNARTVGVRQAAIVAEARATIISWPSVQCCSSAVRHRH